MSPPVKRRKTKNSAKELVTMEQILNLDWCKSGWSYPDINEETKQLLRQCINLPPAELIDDVDEIIRRSDAFPVPFPINTVRLKELKKSRPEGRLKRNITSTYTVIHERVLVLMANFLQYKKKFGSKVEKALYNEMTVPQLVERVLQKRAATFLSARDKYKLVTGQTGADGWESVGSDDERPPLVLENCLSYDEMKLSAMVFVSGYTECINDGARKNSGVVQEDGIEEEAVIIGVIGSRFKRAGRMDCEDILITKEQNTAENGYGAQSDTARRKWRKMWADFFGLPIYTYEEVSALIREDRTWKDEQYANRFVRIAPDAVFDNCAYYRRTAVLIESALREAEARGQDAGASVYLNVIGAGLGVWKASKHQEDVYVVSFLERIRYMLEQGSLKHVTDVNFAYIKPGKRIAGLFKQSASGDQSPVQRMFMDSNSHPKGGVNVQLESREPTSKLAPEHTDKLLVITYPWDGNAHPGNEFWIGKLGSSGDPAAACSTQISELHNAHINPALSGLNVRVARRNGLSTLSDCCLALSA